MAPDLELNVANLLVLFYVGGCIQSVTILSHPYGLLPQSLQVSQLRRPRDAKTGRGTVTDVEYVERVVKTYI